MRVCPICKIDLTQTQLYTQQVDRCDKCDGIFFDAGELEAINKLVQIFSQVVLEEEDIDTVPLREHERIILCPNDGTAMIPKDFGGLFIDQCPECGGIWLDDGEVAALKITEKHVENNINLYIRLGE